MADAARWRAGRRWAAPWSRRPRPAGRGGLRHAAAGRRAAAGRGAAGWDRARLVIDRARADAGGAGRFEALLARREAREPVAYILGRRDFRRLTLAVDRARADPAAGDRAAGRGRAGAARRARRWPTSGTGSGAVALALADERPDLDRARARRRSAARSRWRGPTRARLGLDGRASRAATCSTTSRYDAVLANLPYVARRTRRWRPRSPSTSRPGRCSPGPTGSTLVRRLVGAGRPGVGRALLALEIGPEQARARWRRCCRARPGYRRGRASRRDLAGSRARGGGRGGARRERRREPGSTPTAVRALHGGRRGGRVPVRHRLRAGLRRAEPGRRRAPLPAQAPPAGQALGGDVLRRSSWPWPRCPSSARAPARRWPAAARAGHGAAAQPGAALSAGLRRGPADPGPAGARWCPRCAGCAGRCCSPAPTWPAGPRRGGSTRCPSSIRARGRHGDRRRRAARAPPRRWSTCAATRTTDAGRSCGAGAVQRGAAGAALGGPVPLRSRRRYADDDPGRHPRLRRVPGRGGRRPAATRRAADPRARDGHRGDRPTRCSARHPGR